MWSSKSKAYQARKAVKFNLVEDDFISEYLGSLGEGSLSQSGPDPGPAGDRRSPC